MSTEKSETPRMIAACRDARGIDEGCKLELELAAANERLVTMRKAFETSPTEEENKRREQLAAAQKDAAKLRAQMMKAANFWNHYRRQAEDNQDDNEADRMIARMEDAAKNGSEIPG